MTDLISRADAIEAVAEEWLSEASAESPYVNDDDIGGYRKLAEKLFEDVPSAELPKGDLISRADAIEAVLTYFIPRSHTGERGEHEEDFVRTIFKALPSADAVEIVRCKDCYWYDKGKNDCDSWEWCKRHKFDSYDEGFCSWATHKKQVTSKLKSVEISTDKGDKSTMSQPNGKLESADAVEVMSATIVCTSGV